MSRVRRLQRLPRKLYTHSHAWIRGRTEGDVTPGLRLDPDAPALLLSPHWDDAVLSCWSVLTDESELNVVNLFAGVPPPGRVGAWETVAGVPDSAERAHGRIAEDARALSRAGRKPLGLALLDVKYRRTRTEVNLAGLDRALSALVPSASRVYVPAGIGAHPDHVLARHYGRLLLKAGMPVTMYAELPYCVFHGWPPWVDGRPPAHNRNVDAYWLSFLAGVPEMPALRSGQVQHLAGSAAAAKLAAISCYELSLNFSVRQMLSQPGFCEFEVLWPLASPAAAHAHAHATE